MLAGLVCDYAGVLTDPDADELYAALDSLRDKGIRTALLSNAPGGSASAKARLAAYFDAVVFSGEVGVAKPDAEIYRIAADRLGLSAGSCVFIDDSARNVAGAVTSGMVGIRHTSVAETLVELSALFPVR